MFNHQSVLLNEVIDYLNIKPDGIYVDMTLGGAGHAKEIYSKLNNDGLLIAIDQDIIAIENAQAIFKNKTNVIIEKSNFENIQDILIKHNIQKVDGILFDLGVSSMQFDEADRGFSYRFDAKLDMRMNQEQSLSAYQVVNEYSFNELMFILSRYGEEKYAKNIARAIEKKRDLKPIETTFELVEIIKSALPQAVLKKKGHPAKQTFQAIRIEVNQELSVFKKALDIAINSLKSQGRVVVISFHSLEDRLTKLKFKEYTTSTLPKEIIDFNNIENIEYKLITRKAISPSDNELDSNKRAKSSKLRVIEKI